MVQGRSRGAGDGGEKCALSDELCYPRLRVAAKTKKDEASPGALSIDLRKATEAHSISKPLLESWCEAAAVTLERFHPPQPLTSGSVRVGESERPATLTWTGATEVMRASHANTIDATAMGAYAVAAMVVNAACDWVVVGRTHNATGADLAVLRRDDSPEEFFRLEVSGIAESSGRTGHAKMAARLREKIDQLARSNDDRPGAAVVVGFQTGRTLVAAGES